MAMQNRRKSEKLNRASQAVLRGPGMTDVTTFEVDQIAENAPTGEGLHRVQVRLSTVAWRQLLGDIARAAMKARAARRPIWAAFLGAGATDVRGLERLDAITRLRVILGMEDPSWDLSPEEATALGNALLEAAEEPESCDCGRFIERPSSLTTGSGCQVCAAPVFGSDN
jgi:hypothetical protein